MHIGFITPEYPHQNYTGSIGGVGTFTKNLALQLVKNNCSVSVFIHSQPKNETVVENGVTIHFVKQKRIKGLTWYTNRRFFNSYVNKIVQKDNITVLEAPEWTGFTAFMKFKCPLVIRLHGSDTYFCNLENRPVKSKNKFFEKKALLGATKIIGVSNFVANKTKELFKLGVNINTLYNTIDANQFQPNHTHVKPKTVLYFGTIVRKKGVLEIAEVFNKLVENDDEITLTLLGRDNTDVFTGISTLQMIKTKLTTKALQNLKHIPPVPYQEVKQYIQQAEVVLLPSFAEAFPMTWLEAMAMEKKLVTSNIGWAKELMIDGETGYMVNPKNHKEFTIKVLHLLNDNIGDKMAKNARKHIIKNFNTQQAIQQNIALYKALV